MMSLLLAALLQSTPAAGQGDGLPKDDYERVAWCHGALAAQLELDPIVKADMEKLEGKAKVAARAKEDAELAKERRQYLKDFEHALSAAEKASPTMIHPKGVAAEQQGYRLWAPTRNKEPIWRMLDWGMWDANDAGCGDAAKRLLTKSQLFGAALRNDDQAETAPPPPAAAEVETGKTELADPAKAPVETPAAASGEALTAEVAPTPEPSRPPPPKKSAKLVKVAPKPKARAKPAAAGSAEAIRDAIANGKAELDRTPAATPDAPAPAAEAPPLRGPQQP